MLPNLTASDRARIWATVGPPNDRGPSWLDQPCRDWAGYLNEGGYGLTSIGQRRYRAHRLVFLLTGGVLTAEHPFVCHRCNRPSCCEPSHLYADSPAGNMRYMAEQGRHGSKTRPDRVPRGERHGSRTHPELLPRGERNGRSTKPERTARGDRSGARLHPERLARGDQHYARARPELLARGERSGNAKLTAELVVYVRTRFAAGGVTMSELARELGVNSGTIFLVVRRKAWTHLP